MSKLEVDMKNSGNFCATSGNPLACGGQNRCSMNKCAARSCSCRTVWISLSYGHVSLNLARIGPVDILSLDVGVCIGCDDGALESNVED